MKFDARIKQILEAYGDVTNFLRAHPDEPRSPEWMLTQPPPPRRPTNPLTKAIEQAFSDKQYFSQDVDQSVRARPGNWRLDPPTEDAFKQFIRYHQKPYASCRIIAFHTRNDGELHVIAWAPRPKEFPYHEYMRMGLKKSLTAQGFDVDFGTDTSLEGYLKSRVPAQDDYDWDWKREPEESEYEFYFALYERYFSAFTPDHPVALELAARYPSFSQISAG